MRALAAVRRAKLVITIEVLAAGAAILVSGCAAQTAHLSASRAVATRRAAKLRSGAWHRTAPTHPATTHPATTHPATPSASRESTANAALAAALAPVLRKQGGALAVGVIDETTGLTVGYHTSVHFETASIVKADILAILLMNHQKTGTALSSSESQLAARMIEASDNNAATALWDIDDRGSGLDDGDAVLGLSNTWPAPSGAWGLTATTVADQLRLLTDLNSSHSPLDTASRSYELGLMRQVEVGQNWGVTAAADPGSGFAVKNGWLPLSQGWIVNSIGIVTHDGHQLLIAVLSDGQSSEASGIRQVQAAADIAADIAVPADSDPVTTSSRSATPVSTQ